MSTFDDSSFEMHDDLLTPDTAERLLDGEILSPEFADLAAMVDDVRNVASATPTPEVRGALAEYIGVGLTATESSAEPPAPAAASADLDLTTADQSRRRTVFAEVLTFAGTVSGKLLLGGAVAVASVSGAQAAGVVDLPGLPDKSDTVVVADTPIDDAPAQLPLEDETDEPKPDVVETDTIETEKVPETNFAEEFEAAKDKAEAAAEEAAEAAAEKAAEEKAAEEAAAEKEAEEKAAAEKEAAERAEDKPKEDKPKDESNDPAADALLAQLIADKEAVYAAATALIEPLEAEKKPLVQALEATLATLEQARNDAKAPLYAELETTENEERRIEIEAELSAIFEQWELDRDAAIAAASPAITAIEVQLEDIEIERDAEISRLLEQYQADLEALQK